MEVLKRAGVVDGRTGFSNDIRNIFRHIKKQEEDPFVIKDKTRQKL